MLEIEDIQKQIKNELYDLFYELDGADELEINYKVSITNINVNFFENKEKRYSIEYDRRENEINIQEMVEYNTYQATREMNAPITDEITEWFDKIVEYIEKEKAYNERNYSV